MRPPPAYLSRALASNLVRLELGADFLMNASSKSPELLRRYDRGEWETAVAEPLTRYSTWFAPRYSGTSAI